MAASRHLPSRAADHLERLGDGEDGDHRRSTLGGERGRQHADESETRPRADATIHRSALRSGDSGRMLGGFRRIWARRPGMRVGKSVRPRTSVTGTALTSVPTLNLTASAGIRWSNASLEAADPTRD